MNGNAESQKYFVRKAFSLFLLQVIPKFFPFISAFFMFQFYSAEELGEFGVFMAVATILANFTSLAYETSLLSAKNEREITVGVFGCVYVVGVSCFVQAICALLAYRFFLKEPYIFFLPIYTGIYAFSLVVRNLLLRFHYEYSLSLVRILDSALCNVALIGLGYAGWGLKGLMISGFLSLLPSFLGPFFWVYNKVQFTPPPFSSVISFYKDHARMPTFLAMAKLFENLSVHAHMMLFSFLFPIHVLGQLYVVQRILLAPIHMMEFIIQFILKALYHNVQLEEASLAMRSFVKRILIFCVFALPLGYLLLDGLCHLEVVKKINEIRRLLFVFKVVFPLYLSIYVFQTITPFLIAHKHHHQILRCYIGGFLIAVMTFAVGWMSKCSFDSLLIGFVFAKSAWILRCVFVYLKKNN